MQTRHRLTQAIFFRKQNLIIIVIINIIVIIIMPSSFVHADRLSFEKLQWRLHKWDSWSLLPYMGILDLQVWLISIKLKWHQRILIRS